MKVLKAKIKKTVAGALTEIPGLGKGYSATIQTVFYSSKNPSSFLYLYDGDNDLITMRIPGQGTEDTDPNPVALEIPTTVQLPIYYLDTTDGNTIIIRGILEKIETRLDSSF